MVGGDGRAGVPGDFSVRRRWRGRVLRWRWAGGGDADSGAGGGGGGYSYAAPNAKFISYPSSGTQLSVAITPVSLSMSAHVESGSPRHEP